MACEDLRVVFCRRRESTMLGTRESLGDFAVRILSKVRAWSNALMQKFHRGVHNWWISSRQSVATRSAELDHEFCCWFNHPRTLKWCCTRSPCYDSIAVRRRSGYGDRSVLDCGAASCPVPPLQPGTRLRLLSAHLHRPVQPLDAHPQVWRMPVSGSGSWEQRSR